MEIGQPKKTIVIMPLEEPLGRPKETPAPPVPVAPTPTPVKVPVPA